MQEVVDSVTWEAPEHVHMEKGADWYWALGVVTLGAAVAAFFLGNLLFALVIGIGGLVLGLFATQEPKVIPFGVTPRGIRIDQTLYPYTTLESFHIDEDHRHGPHLLLKSQKTFAPLVIVPLPPDHLSEIQDLIGTRLPEEFLEEPFINQLLEFLGF